MTFTEPLKIEQLPDGRRWKVLKGFTYYTEEGNITIGDGFVTDGASIPRFFWRIIGHPLGRYAQASILHDYLYYMQRFSYASKDFITRLQADDIFLEAMETLGVSWWKRWLMYRGVRIFGRFGWSKRREEILDKR